MHETTIYILKQVIQKDTLNHFTPIRMAIIKITK